MGKRLSKQIRSEAIGLIEKETDFENDHLSYTGKLILTKCQEINAKRT